MVVTQDAGVIGDGLLVQCDGAGEIAGCPVGAGQVGAGVDGVGVVRALDALIVGKVAFVQV